MARSLLDEFSSLLTPDLLGRAASAFGESSDGVGRALGAAAPALLAGVVGKVNEPRGAQEVLGFLNDPANPPNLVSNLGALLGPDRGSSANASLASRFLTSLFGTRSDTVANAVRQASGVQPSTASSLLPIAASIVLGLLGNRVRTEGLNASGLASLLLGQRDAILGALPAGLGSVLNLASLRSLGTGAAAAATGAAAGTRSLWPIAAAIALLLGAWWLFRTFSREPAPTELTPPPVATAPATPPAVSAPAPTASLFERTLPSGYTLRAPEVGIEQRLVVFIEDSSQGVSEDTWFDFDRLLFETGSGMLKPESREQLRNVAEILKAYPETKVKIGGYTDNTGDPDTNLRLSNERATTVVTELVALGISPDRLSSEGYGEQHPVADNSTEEGRAKNRRIALRVTEK
jgi:outer membrane protein OmpA-like peptidoglycan-associated protein